jgi:carbohydrate esterase-like sialic acid-specific acetylesterase
LRRIRGSNRMSGSISKSFIVNTSSKYFVFMLHVRLSGHTLTGNTPHLFRGGFPVFARRSPRRHAFRTILAFLAVSATTAPQAWALDPDFHIYLAFGQSNMEGNGPIPAAEKTGVNARWKVMAAVNCTNLGRTKGSWYTAVPPLCRCNTGMTPADYFGRTLVDSLPPNITVGVINVSVAGSACSMEISCRLKSRQERDSLLVKSRLPLGG